MNPNSYYCAIINGEFVDMLSKEYIMSLNKDNITLISKEYYPINENNILSRDKESITLYTADFPYMTYDEYINNYNNLPKLYGVNAINDDDLEICKHFNYKNTKKRTRTYSIDYE